jgi:hypothetical protein
MFTPYVLLHLSLTICCINRMDGGCCLHDLLARAFCSVLATRAMDQAPLTTCFFLVLAQGFRQQHPPNPHPSHPLTPDASPHWPPPGWECRKRAVVLSALRARPICPTSTTWGQCGIE